MREGVWKQVGDLFKRDNRKCVLDSKEFAATRNGEADIVSAISKGLEKVGKDVCSTIPSQWLWMLGEA